VHEDVTAAWERVTEQWDDPARHDALIGLVAQHNCFAWAAARYKERAGDAVADKQLERLQRAATATMLAAASVRGQPERTPYKRTMVVMIVMLVMVVLGLLAAKVLHDRRATSTPHTTKPARY
jgi:hypothetical protein